MRVPRSFYDGVRAFEGGYTGDNPFPAGSEDRDFWARGWMTASNSRKRVPVDRERLAEMYRAGASYDEMMIELMISKVRVERELNLMRDEGVLDFRDAKAAIAAQKSVATVQQKMVLEDPLNRAIYVTADELKRRRCMGCQTVFFSFGRHNRLCAKCREEGASDSPFDVHYTDSIGALGHGRAGYERPDDAANRRLMIADFSAVSDIEIAEEK